MHLRISTDGGARGNPGPAAAGVVIRNHRGQSLFSGGFLLGQTTSNVAEYRALLQALEIAQHLGGSELDIACDSELVVRQVNGQYRVKKAHLQVLHAQVTALLAGFDKALVRHVRREQNAEADALVNAALDAGRNVRDAAGEPGQNGKATGETEPTPSDIDSEGVLSAALLPKRVRFDAGKAVSELLCASDTLASELLCLSTSQKHTWGPQPHEATLTVLRGRGSATVDGTRRILQPGVWLHLAKAVPVTLQAAADQELVILVTQAAS